MASKGTLTVRIIGDAKSFNDTLGDMGGKLKSFGKAIPKIAGAAFLGAGVAIGGALTAGFFEALDREAAQDKLAARFGLSENEAKRLGTIAAGVYTDAWGESVGDVMAVIADLNDELGNITAMPEDEIRDLTVAAIALRDVFGVEMAESIGAVSNLLANDMAGSAEEAFDVIARGLQEGANRRDDFLDTLLEYADAWESLGIDAATASGIIVAGLDAGAFSADKVGDAINEFGIRAIDGSKTTSRAFEIIGLEADDMAAKIAGGGPSAREATDQIIDALRNVDDAVKQDEAGVGLFGSMWEDVGKDVILSIDPINGALDNVAGTVDRVTSTAEDNISTRMSSAWRKFTDLVPQAIQDSGMLDAIDRILDRFDEEGLAGAIDQLSIEWARSWPKIEAWWENDVMPWWNETAVGMMKDAGTDMGIALANGLIEALAELVPLALEGLANTVNYGIESIVRTFNDALDFIIPGGDIFPNLDIPAADFPSFDVPDIPSPTRNRTPEPPTQTYNPDRTYIGGGRTVSSAPGATTINVYNPAPSAAEQDISREMRLRYP